MQIKFNPHLPPGYFQMHEVEGVAWRSERPVRAFLTERAVAEIVARFASETGPEMDERRRSDDCRRIRREYETEGMTLDVDHHPWERIPTVSLRERGRGQENR